MVSFLNYISVKFQKTNVTTAMVYFFSLRDAFFLLFFTVEISISGTAEVQTLYAPLNESVTIEWKIKEQETQHEKEWTWTKTVGGTSITLAKIDDQGKDKYPFAQQFKGRLKMHPNGSLTISGLLYIDSGRYQQAMILIEKEQQSHLLDLIIIKKITNVKISLDSNITLNDRCNLTLSCTAEDGSNVSYSWTVPNNNPSFYSGANLHVSLPVTNEGMLITCKASNPISSKIYHFSTREVCGVPNTGDSANSVQVVLILSVFGVLLCAGITVLVVIIRKSKARHSGRNKTNGEANYSEPTTVYATVTKCPPKKANDIPETQEEDEGAGPSVTLYEEVRGQKSHNHYQENRHPQDSSKGCQGTVYDMVRHVETQSRDETE